MFRPIIRNLILNSLGNFSRPSNSVHILNGHYACINNDFNKEKFRSFLIKLNTFCDFIDFDKAIDIILKKQKVDKPLLAFSFDDGFLECYEVIAPVFDEMNIKVCFFVNATSIGLNSHKEEIKFLKNNLKVNFYKKFMNLKMLKSLKNRGHIIGNHTHNHIALKKIGFKKSFDEVNASKNWLEENLKYSCDYFAFPFGNPSFFDDDGIKAVKILHKYNFSSGNHFNYFHDKKNNILTRRHFEGDWPVSYIRYFLSSKRKYNI